MVAALQASEIDLAVGLTEGWVSGICKARAHAPTGHRHKQHPANFEIVGTYVKSPLRWAISTGLTRSDVNGVADLKGKRVGVSRIGSGSYVMSYVLAQQQGWLDPERKSQTGETLSPFPVEVLDTFLRLREGVQENINTADFFMWEYFTSKKYYLEPPHQIKHIGDIYSPWASWMIVANTKLLYPHGRHKDQPVLTEQLEDVLEKVNLGIRHFKENEEEAVRYISEKLDYSEEDARAWLPTVRFAEDVRGVRRKAIVDTMDILETAGVIEEQKVHDKVEGVAALLR